MYSFHVSFIPLIKIKVVIKSPNFASISNYWKYYSSSSNSSSCHLTFDLSSLVVKDVIHECYIKSMILYLPYIVNYTFNVDVVVVYWNSGQQISRGRSIRSIPGRTRPPTNLLFNYHVHSAKQFRQFKFTLLGLVSAVLGGQQLISKVRMGLKLFNHYTIMIGTLKSVFVVINQHVSKQSSSWTAALVAVFTNEWIIVRIQVCPVKAGFFFSFFFLLLSLY